MKRSKLTALIIVIILSVCLSAGCGSPNHETFTQARIFQEGRDMWETDVKSWTQYGDMIQIETKAGLIILVDKSNVILTNK
jgi:ABC-type glycerol-3-phosphate transport system substrate-binding protein